MLPPDHRDIIMKPLFPRAVALFLLCGLAPVVEPASAQTANAGRNLAAACFTCHGTNANSVGGVPPSLAGRPAPELFQIMKEFQSGKRPATVMHQQARGYTDEQLQLIAAFIAGLKPEPAKTAARAASQ
jgi:cytochrome subunit of sulfide dehydrogenase